MLGQKTSLSKFKKTEIKSSIFSDHNSMRLEVKRKKTAKKTQTQFSTKIQWITEENFFKFGDMK